MNANRFSVLLAQGLGSGRAPRAPGTWGSAVGVLWFAFLLLPGNPWFFLTVSVSVTAFAIWACGRAERILGLHDPGSIVLDEIVAVPWCFSTLLLEQTQAGGFPDLGGFLQAWPWWTVPVGFAAFRLFDIWKPWPIRRSQQFRGGWGVVIDDLLAAVWVNVGAAAAMGAGMIQDR